MSMHTYHGCLSWHRNQATPAGGDKDVIQPIHWICQPTGLCKVMMTNT